MGPRTLENDDALLLKRIARGDKAAFEALYRSYGGRVLGMLRHLTRDRSQAEDLLQDVFMAVWKKAASYRPERGSPEGWLFTIARNKVADDRRRRQRRREEPDSTDKDRPAPEPMLRIRDLGLSLGQAMTGLTQDQRAALSMTYFYGFTYREAAEQLAVPLGTLKSRITTALRSMRIHLENP